MTSDRSSRRRTRSGQKRRDEPSDVLVIALTAQVVICLLLLLSANIGKRLDQHSYDALQGQYSVLVTDETETGRALAYLSEKGVDGLLMAVKNAFSSLFGKKEPAAPENDVQENADTPSLPDETDIDEPVPEQRPLPKRDYNYLQPQESALATAGGQGGFFPIDLAGQVKQALTSPKGSVLSPVYLGGKIIPPVTGVITSDFAYRYHPITETTDFHTGMDIAAEEGRAILAALPGEVVEVGESAIYGHYIVLQHASNLQTSYSHCSEILASEGMKVRQGERIAKVGQSGTATGPHLHFSVLVDGLFTDPYWVLEDHIKLVS